MRRLTTAFVFLCVPYAALLLSPPDSPGDTVSPQEVRTLFGACGSYYNGGASYCYGGNCQGGGCGCVYMIPHIDTGIYQPAPATPCNSSVSKYCTSILGLTGNLCSG